MSNPSDNVPKPSPAPFSLSLNPKNNDQQAQPEARNNVQPQLTGTLGKLMGMSNSSTIPKTNPATPSTDIPNQTTTNSSQAETSTSNTKQSNNATTGTGTAPSGKSSPKSSGKRKRSSDFRRELKSVMYGFGDEWSPLEDTVTLMDKIVKEYIVGMTGEATRVAGDIGSKLDEKCLLYTVRRDKRKADRIGQLLATLKELKSTKSQHLNQEHFFFKEKGKKGNTSKKKKG